MATRKKRDRGRLLTDGGYTRIWTAIRTALPDRQTYAAIARWTEPDQDNPNVVTYITAETVSVILNRRRGVDQKSIEHLFGAFGLTLAANDHASSGDTTQPELDASFVGRERAFAELDVRIQQGAQVIVIKAAGGVGKTTLARKYLEQKFGWFLEFPIAKETKDIASVEALLEEKLRQLGEEPGRELMVSLDRLKRKLQAESIGILIDNLEPALNAQGQFIDEHRSYVELLRVLADSSIQAVTLITSRERLREPSVSLEHYQLEGLTLSAWEQFFQNRSLDTATESLAHLHHAYAGNAKAMELLRSSILEDYFGDINAYWNENQDELLIEADLESLVITQFERLKNLDPNAYKLLIRMGCYRYQDVPDIPMTGVSCLLWDISSEHFKRIIKSLRDRSLLEKNNENFLLHPVVRAESIKRLRADNDWELANRKAAENWKIDIREIESPIAGLRALEAFYHYFSIRSYDDAARVVVDPRIMSEFSHKESLAGRLRGFGLYSNCLHALEKLVENHNHISSSSSKGLIFANLGDVNFILGNSERAISLYHKAIKIFGDNIIYCCDSMVPLSVTYMNVAEYELALEQLEKVIGLREEILNMNKSSYTSWVAQRILATAYASLVLVNWRLKKEIEDNDNIEHALQLCHALQEYSGSWWENYGNFNLARALVCLKRTDTAKKVCIYLYKHSRVRSDPMSKGLALSASAEICVSQNQIPKGIRNFENAIKVFRYIEAKQWLAESLASLSLLYKKDNLNKSMELLQESIELFRMIGAPKKIKEIQKIYEDYPFQIM